jgi:dihydroflavonol-4-reductase
MGESYDCGKAIKELGLPQTPIDVAIGKALEWFRANDYLPRKAVA